MDINIKMQVKKTYINGHVFITSILKTILSHAICHLHD